MRKSVLAAAVLFLLNTPSYAQVYHLFPGAPVVSAGEVEVGPYLSIGDNLVRMGGFARFNLNKHIDVGLEGILDNSHDNWRAGAGADLKYLVAPTSFSLPFELALNGGIGFDSGNHVTNILFPLGALASRTLILAQGRELTPYGGIYVVIYHISSSITVPGFGVIPDRKIDFDDTDTDVELRMGASFRFMPRTYAFAALHLGMGNRFYIGITRGL